MNLKIQEYCSYLQSKKGEEDQELFSEFKSKLNQFEPDYDSPMDRKHSNVL